MPLRPRLVAALLGLALAAPLARAQDRPSPGPPPAAAPLDAKARTEVIDAVLARLEAEYVFPDRARDMAAAIRQRQQQHAYDALTDGRAFADSLTAHLRAVSHDLHLGVMYNPGIMPMESPDDEPGVQRSPEMQQRMAAQLRFMNFGFEKVSHLEGNVGYLELSGFAPADVAGAEDVVAAAMSFLSGTDALIIDLRGNGGGEPSMVRLLASYFFGPDPVHLNSLYWRKGNQTEEFWTLRDLKGPRYGAERPVYVLTSRRTFSGAEEFSYDLQTRKRATIVGETTGGGAHPGGMRRINDHFAVWVPTGRAINPVTGTNWEGTGVSPDVPAPADAALRTAHLAALRALLAASTVPEHRDALEHIIPMVASQP